MTNNPNVFKRYLFGIVYAILIKFVIFLFIILMPGTILLNVEPEYQEISFPEELKHYEQNVHVKSFRKIIGNIKGPESIAHYHGRLVTGCVDGYLYEINDSKDTPFKRLIRLVNDDMLMKTNYTRFSRPLGLRFDSNGNLWAVEPMFGVFKVEDIFSPNPKVDLVFDIEKTTQFGPISLFLDDLALEEKSPEHHILYISDVSSKFTMDEFLLVAFSSEKGRILRYDTKTKILDILVEDLIFPNGIELLADKSGVIFSEIGTRSIWKYLFNNSQASKILSNMPAESDNIRMSFNNQTYWLTMAKPRSMNSLLLGDYMAKYPLLRKFTLRSTHLIGSILEFVHKIIPMDYVQNLAINFKTLKIFFPPEFEREGIILEIDHNGNIITSIYNSTSVDYGLITEVKEIQTQTLNERTLYLGTYEFPYIRKITITK